MSTVKKGRSKKANMWQELPDDLLHLIVRYSGVDVIRALALMEKRTLRCARPYLQAIGKLGPFWRCIKVVTTLYRDSRKGCPGLQPSHATALGELLKLNFNIGSLKLLYHTLSAESVSAIATGLRESETVTALSLQNAMEPLGATHIARALPANATLTKLDLDSNKIDDDGATALADGLVSNATLTSLKLWFNRIGDEGAAALANGLKRNATLTRLELDYNKIGDRGATALAAALRGNAVVKNLRLCHNRSIGDQGAAALADALTVKTTALTILGLICAGIGSQGARALADALAVNVTLEVLDILCNGVGAEAGGILAKALPFNATLKKLQISGAAKRELREVCASKRIQLI